MISDPSESVVRIGAASHWKTHKPAAEFGPEVTRKRPSGAQGKGSGGLIESIIDGIANIFD